MAPAGETGHHATQPPAAGLLDGCFLLLTPGLYPLTARSPPTTPGTDLAAGRALLLLHPSLSVFFLPLVTPSERPGAPSELLQADSLSRNFVVSLLNKLV